MMAFTLHMQQAFKRDKWDLHLFCTSNSPFDDDLSVHASLRNLSCYSFWPAAKMTKRFCFPPVEIDPCLNKCTRRYSWTLSFRSLYSDGHPLFTVRTLLPPANEVWGKVIFLHLFVILFTGGGVPGLGVPGPGGCQLRGVPAAGGCLLPGGPAPGGSALGGCLVETPPATAAGGTHPTGMHSCYSLIRHFLKLVASTPTSTLLWIPFFASNANVPCEHTLKGRSCIFNCENLSRL